MQDSLVGLWRGTYVLRGGAPPGWQGPYGDLLVSMTGTPAGYTMTSMEAYPTKRFALHRLPAGTLVAQLHWTGGSSYGGVHGTWWVDTWRFARWNQTWLTLDPSGTTLSGPVANHHEDLVYRRVLGEQDPRRPAAQAPGFPLSLGSEAGANPELGRIQDGPTRRERGSSGISRLWNRQRGS